MSISAYLDARELLASGQDPLGAALRLAATVGENDSLIVDAPFDPLPLRNLLAGKGFSSWVGPAPTGGVRASFLKDGRGCIENGEPPAHACQGVPRWEADGQVHIDVRGLTPPLPMVLILRLLRDLPADAQIVVHHDRDPVYLYPELAELGWRAQVVAGDPGEVRLLLERVS